MAALSYSEKIELGTKILRIYARGQKTLSVICSEAGVKPAVFRNWVLADVADIDRYIAAGNALPSSAVPDLIPLYREAKILAASNWEADITDLAHQSLRQLVTGYKSVEVKVKRVKEKDAPADDPNSYYDEVTTITKQIAPNMEAVRMVLEAKVPDEYDKDTRKRLAQAEDLQKAIDADSNEYESWSIAELQQELHKIDDLKQGKDGTWER